MKRTITGLTISLFTLAATGLVWWRSSWPPQEYRGWFLLAAMVVIGLAGYWSAGSVPPGSCDAVAAIRSTGMVGWGMGAVAYPLLVPQRTLAWALFCTLPIVYVGLFRASEIGAHAANGAISTRRSDSLVPLACTLVLLWADRQQMALATMAFFLFVLAANAIGAIGSATEPRVDA